MTNVTEERAAELIRKAQHASIAVIGDVMLDRYFWGSVSRISPEAPVPVVDIEDESALLGGAANVANNLKSLGAEPLLCGLLGDDSDGAYFIEIARKSGIDTSGLFVESGRPTTVKTRIIGNSQHITRLDREHRAPISVAGSGFILQTLKSLKNLSGIIFEDYNKGTVSKELIQSIIRYASDSNIPVYVDPKFENFFEYKNVAVFKPNKKEARQALGLPMENKAHYAQAGRQILERLDCGNVLLTLGNSGMMLFEANGDISSVPTRALAVADVSGAGDTAIAALAAIFSSGGSIKEAASIANFASGVVCGKPGIVPITPSDLLSAIADFNRDLNGKGISALS